MFIFKGNYILALSIKHPAWFPSITSLVIPSGLVVRCVHAQSCPALCDPMDCSPPGSSVHGIFQARILEWVTISYSRGSSWPRYRTYVSYVSFIGRQIFFITAPPRKPLIVTKIREPLHFNDHMLTFWLQIMEHLIIIQRQITELSFRNKVCLFNNSVKLCSNVTL